MYLLYILNTYEQFTTARRRKTSPAISSPYNNLLLMPVLLNLLPSVVKFIHTPALAVCIVTICHVLCFAQIKSIKPRKSFRNVLPSPPLLIDITSSDYNEYEKITYFLVEHCFYSYNNNQICALLCKAPKEKPLVYFPFNSSPVEQAREVMVH